MYFLDEAGDYVTKVGKGGSLMETMKSINLMGANIL